MSTKKSPLQRVKEKFESKEKLVEALLGLPESVLERTEGDDKDGYKARLLAAANTKLLKLHAVGTAVAQRFGNKDGLVDALLKLENKSKDQDFRRKLQQQSVGKLYDQHQAAERRAKRAQDKKKAA